MPHYTARNKLRDELRYLKHRFSPYDKAHNMAVGVLLMLNEDRPAYLSNAQYAFLVSVLDVLREESGLAPEYILQASALYESKAAGKQLQYAALSYITKLGYKTGWDCPLHVFQGDGFLRLIDELQRVRICGVSTWKKEPQTYATQAAETLGLPREHYQRLGEYQDSNAQAPSKGVCDAGKL